MTGRSVRPAHSASTNAALPVLRDMYPLMGRRPNQNLLVGEHGRSQLDALGVAAPQPDRHLPHP